MSRSLSPEILIKPSSPFDSDASSLITQLDQYQSDLYPAESNHLDSREVLSSENCYFLTAYEDSQPIAIASVKAMDEYGELKRFYVVEKFRGLCSAFLLVGLLTRSFSL